MSRNEHHALPAGTGAAPGTCPPPRELGTPLRRRTETPLFRCSRCPFWCYCHCRTGQLRCSAFGKRSPDKTPQKIFNRRAAKLGARRFALSALFFGCTQNFFYKVTKMRGRSGFALAQGKTKKTGIRPNQSTKPRPNRKPRATVGISLIRNVLGMQRFQEVPVFITTLLYIDCKSCWSEQQILQTEQQNLLVWLRK